MWDKFGKAKGDALQLILAEADLTAVAACAGNIAHVAANSRRFGGFFANWPRAVHTQLVSALGKHALRLQGVNQQTNR